MTHILWVVFMFSNGYDESRMSHKIEREIMSHSLAPSEIPRIYIFIKNNCQYLYFQIRNPWTRDPRTAKLVRVLKVGCRDPRTAESVRFFKRRGRDPRTAESVQILKGAAWIQGLSNRFEFFNGVSDWNKVCKNPQRRLTPKPLIFLNFFFEEYFTYSNTENVISSFSKNVTGRSGNCPYD